MQEIIKPLDIQTIKSELKKIDFIKTTFYGHNELYIFEYKQSPLLMQEVGRLREITFRAAGGGTGLACDLDKYDTCEKPFKQLIVWSPSAECIIGGYRYILGPDIEVVNNEMHSPTGKLFNFTKYFHENYTPYMMELGRSFVIPEYQATSEIRKGLAALDNLWDGIGTIITYNNNIKYLFGKFTMYRSYDLYARDILLNFLSTYFPDNENMCCPKTPIKLAHSSEELNKPFCWNNYHGDYQILMSLVKKNGETIPPLVSSYMNLTSTMKYFGTTLNADFGDVEESGILLTISDMKQNKYDRYIVQNQLILNNNK